MDNNRSKKIHWLQVSESKLQGNLSGNIKTPIEFFEQILQKKV